MLKRLEEDDLMRTSSVQFRSRFFKGLVFGTILVAIKLIFFFPIDIADTLYGAVLLVTLIITIGELLELKYFVLEAPILDYVMGFLFPLDLYAVLVLFRLPLTN
jgi:hypothetical protein